MNLRIFTGLIHELRVKLDIVKAGLAPPKIANQIEQSLNGSKSEKKRQKVIDRIVLSEFNTINIARVQGAVVEP